MNNELFMERYQRFDEKDEAIQLSINTIVAFEDYIEKDIEESSIDDIKRYMDYLIETGGNKYNNVIHIARYYYYVDMKDHYIHMTKYFNSLGVLEHIIDRISLNESDEVKQQIINDMDLPPLFTDSKDLPRYTKRFLDVLNKHLNETSCNYILAGNNHRIPASSFDKEKEYYEQANSLSEYLQGRHQRKVEELTKYYLDNQVWFEQIITPDVIDFVKGNPEVLSGVVENDKLYITKIPYDINNYLTAEDDIMKRYYTCHCSFVRENIVDEKEDISGQWCYCSAGFAKHPYEHILGTELPIKLLETPLEGTNLCRFEIDLSQVEYKK